MLRVICGLQRCSVACNVESRRAANFYHYKSKADRDSQARGKSLEWALPILKNAQQEQTNNKEPHLLHIVYRIKTTQGRPWWEKKIIEQLELDGKMYQPVVHKNVPSINRLLDEVKHLVQILPLHFPHGLPQHESDFEHTLIRSNGELIVKRRLQQFEPRQSVSGQLLEDRPDDKWQLTRDTIKKENDKKLQNFDVHREFFKASYKYRRNQDGNEYRYTFNKDTPQYEW